MRKRKKRKMTYLEKNILKRKIKFISQIILLCLIIDSFCFSDQILSGINMLKVKKAIKAKSSIETIKEETVINNDTQEILNTVSMIDSDNITETQNTQPKLVDEKWIKRFELEKEIVPLSKEETEVTNYPKLDIEQLKVEYDSYVNWLYNRFGDMKHITDEKFVVPMNFDRIYELNYKSTIDYGLHSFFLENEIETRNIDFKSYQEINKDIIGYIEIPDMLYEDVDDEYVDNFLIVQNKDCDYNITDINDKQSPDYYAKHSILGDYIEKGTVYQDSRNDSLENSMPEISDVSIIYGHNYGGKTRFSSIGNLSKKNNQETIQNLPYGILYSASGDLYKIDFFSVNVMDGATDEMLYHENFKSEEEFDEYIRTITESADYCIEENIPRDGSKIIALVTCSYGGRFPFVNNKPNDRTVLFGKLTKQKKYELNNTNDEVKTLKLN